MIGNYDDEINCPHKLLPTNRQVTTIRKAFANHPSTDIKLLKTQLSNMIQLGGFLGRLLGPLQRTGLPLPSVIQPLDSVLIPLRLKQQHQQQMQEYITESKDLVITQP